MNKTFAIMATALALASCSSNKNVKPIDITGQWSIVSAMGKSTEGGERPAFIKFDEKGEMNGNATVNHFFGGYELKDNQISFTNIGMTRMWGPSMEIETAISQALDQAATIQTEGNKMYFFNSSNDTIMTLVKE